MKPRPTDAVPERSAQFKPEGRGRRARSPAQIPPKGWWDVLHRVYQQLEEDNLTIVAAGVAFYAFLALVPALAAVVGIYGLVTHSGDISRHIAAIGEVLPPQALQIVEGELQRISADSSAAGWSAFVGVGFALFASTKATRALIIGLNITYDETERRSFFRLQLILLCLTLAAIIGAVVLVGTIAVLPAVLEQVGLKDSAEMLINVLRWPALAVVFALSLGVLYRFAPCRNAPQWKWLTPGAALGTSFWILGSIGFSIYVNQFGDYDKTYGSLGAIVVFLLWLYITAYVVLLGAELNAELERQTAQDTTTGHPKEMGQREAYAADTLGETKESAKQKAKEKRSP